MKEGIFALQGEKAGHESKSQEEPSAQENRSEAASVEAQEANQAEKLAEASTAAQRVEMLEQQLKGVQTQLEESQSRAALFSTNGDPEVKLTCWRPTCFVSCKLVIFCLSSLVYFLHDVATCSRIFAC